MLTRLSSKAWLALGATTGAAGLGWYSTVHAQGAVTAPPGDLRPTPGISHEIRTGPKLSATQRDVANQPSSAGRDTTNEEAKSGNEGRSSDRSGRNEERAAERKSKHEQSRAAPSGDLRPTPGKSHEERTGGTTKLSVAQRGVATQPSSSGRDTTNEHVRSTDRSGRNEERASERTSRPEQSHVFGAGDSTAPPGEGKSFATKTMEMGASMIQNLDPVRSLSIHMDGFLQDARNKNTLLEVHKYCHNVNEDFMQCLLYDDDKSDSKLVGVEYLISKRIYDVLPGSEKGMWHSVEHEVKSGLSVAPRLPDMAEHKLMEHMANFYAKAWKTWPVEDKAPLPVGKPDVLLPVEEDSALHNSGLLRKRDQNLGISTDDIRRRRADIKAY